MRIDEKRPDIETYGGGKEESFSVGNLGRIFKILRNSMYAHPIKAICREVASNARDAHREIGTPEKPIQIHLPNNWDNHFKIKDFGPGISPDRMSNIFLKYGNSTKNSDDVQTGGFGLGAKTPFAYSDQFQITSISEDDGVRTKRIYVAYIDESEEGKMRLVSEVKTDEPTGCEVSINVAEVDFHKFSEATTEVCRYWDPKPELTGRVTVEWPEETRELFLEGEGWQMFKNKDNHYYDYNEARSLAIVDGIQYPINISNIDGLNEDNGSKLLKRGLKLFFETGDVRLSANREELQYDEKTCPIILSRLEDCQEQVSKLIESGVEKAGSFAEAVVKYNEFRTHLGFAIRKDWSPEWNGNNVPFGMSVQYAPGRTKGNDGTDHGWEYIIDEFSLRKSRRTYSKVLHRKKTHDMSFHSDGKLTLLLNDLSSERVSRSRVQHYMDENNVEFLYVVTASHGNIDEALDRMTEDNHKKISPRLFDTVLMSTIVVPRKKAGGRRRGQGSSRSAYSAFEYDKSYTANRSCDNYWRPVEIDMENDEGVYVTISGRRNERYMDKKEISDSNVNAIISFIDDDDLKIYGIRERDLKKLGDNWKPLHVLLEERIQEALDDLDLTEQDVADRICSSSEACFEPHQGMFYHDSNKMIAEIFNLNKHLLLPSSTLRQYMEMNNKANDEHKEVASLWNVMSLRGKVPEGKKLYDLKKLERECRESYPLCYSLRVHATNIKDVSQYIMLVDKEKAEEKALGLDNSGADDQLKAANS